MPGPFNSDKIKGVFERDTACIKQNDVWSSATFNKFAKTVYNVFYDESAYSRVFHNPEKPRLMLDCSNKSSDSAVDSGTGLAVKTPNIWFHDNKDRNRIEMHIVDRNFDVNTNVSGGTATDDAPLFDAVKKRLLFSGRGDMSVSSKPYALFQVLSESLVTPPEALSELTGSASDASNVMYDAYCCITYEEGFGLENSTNSSRSKSTPRYSSLSEITFKFDPNLSGTVISRVEGDKVRVVGDAPFQEDVNVKLTLTFGPGVALSDFIDYMNGLTTAGTSRYKAVIVGQALAGQSLISALIKSSDASSIPTEIFTKTIRFVPIRPCIAVLGADSAESFETLTCPEDGISSLTEYTMRGPSGDQVPVFVNTGTYGFIISNSLAEAPVMHDAADLDLVYIPNKNVANHYTTVESTVDPAVPSWYDTLPGRVTRAVTENFNEEFFFVPYITVTDRTIEIGDFSVDIADLTHYGDTVYSIEQTSRQPLRESMVEYDSYAGRADSELLAAAGKVFNKIRLGVKGFYSDPNTHELNDLESTTPWVSSLARTLQFMTGCTWDLNNTVILDPELKRSVPVLKMFRDYPDLFEYEQNVSGQGTILTAGTTVIYVARYGQPAQATISVTDLAMLPCSLKHIAVSLSSTCTVAADSPDFTLYGSTITNLLFGVALPDVSDIFIIELRKQDFSLTKSLAIFSGEYTSDPNFGRVFTTKTDQRLGLAFSGGYYSGISASFGALYAVSFDGDVVVKGNFDETSPLCAPRFVFKQMKELTGETLTLVPSKHSEGTSLYTWEDCNGAKVDIKLLFRQELRYQTSEGIEMRDLSAIHSLISVQGVVENCDITLRIKDTGNTSPWTAPDEETEYRALQWQAFDPDFFLKPAPGIPGFPDTFMFIDCGLYVTSLSGGSSILRNCRLNIDLSEDAVRQEPLYVKEDLSAFRYTTDSRFFASRMFRKSPYVFYFGDRHPYYYNVGQTTDTFSVKQSEGIDLTFILGKSQDRMAVACNISNRSGGIYPSLPECVVDWSNKTDDMVTGRAHYVFISGLADSRLNFPNIFFPPVNKRSYYTLPSVQTYIDTRTQGAAAVLFEAMTDCTIDIPQLYTIYPLQDEWRYSEAYTYDDRYHFWCEQEYGFLFFTYPRLISGSDREVNRHCTLKVGHWITRTVLAGIYGLTASSVSIYYTFTTQVSELEKATHVVNPYNPGRSCYYFTSVDPGSMHKEEAHDGSIPSNTAPFFYLPAAPLFYMAETYSCDVVFEFASKGILGYRPLGGSAVQDDNFSMRSRYFDLGSSPDNSSGIPNFIPGVPQEGPADQYKTMKRPIRLVVGYRFNIYRGSESSFFVAPSSYNTIRCQVTRLNLVAGVMNNASGWCYKLLGSNSQDRIPEHYHPDGGYIYDVDSLYPVEHNRIETDSGILNPDYLSGVGFRSTVWASSKELSFDIAAPALQKYEELSILETLAFLYADDSSTDAGQAMELDKNSVAHAYNCEVSCMDARNNTYKSNLKALTNRWEGGDYGKLFSGKLLPVDFGNSSTVTSKMFTNLPLVNALNRAELNTILIATSDVSYLGVKAPNGASLGIDFPDFSSVLSGYVNYSVKAGGLVHSVLTLNFKYDPI